MEAQLVWDTWRAILASDELAEAVCGSPAVAVMPAGLTRGERAVLASYAADPRAASINIGMVRRGVVRNALCALTLAPLTQRLLFACGVDAETIALAYARSIEYRDDGPNFWRSAAGFVSFLAEQSAFSAPAWQDAIKVDSAAIALMRRLGSAPPAQWPDSVGTPASRAHEGRFMAHSAAVQVSTEHDITPWLAHPHDCATAATLEPAVQHWLVYLPNADAMPAYAELSERAARALAHLSSPMAAHELVPLLDDVPLNDISEALAALLGIGAIVRVP